VKNHILNFTKFSLHEISFFHEIFSVVVAQSSSDDSAVRCASIFADDIMFSHNGANVPESSTMSSFIKFAR